MSIRDNPLDALRAIAEEAKQANAVIALNRDGQGQGRVRVATAMHRIEAMASKVIAAEQVRHAAPELLTALSATVAALRSFAAMTPQEGWAADEIAAALRLADPAIAKATGESR